MKLIIGGSLAVILATVAIIWCLFGPGDEYDLPSRARTLGNMSRK